MIDARMLGIYRERRDPPHVFVPREFFIAPIEHGYAVMFRNKYRLHGGAVMMTSGSLETAERCLARLVQSLCSDITLGMKKGRRE